MIRIVVIAVIMSMSVIFAHADEYRPAYLELRQSSSDIFQVLWKVPAKGGNKRLSLRVQFLDDVSIVSPVLGSFVKRAYIERWTIARSAGLAGARIDIKGLQGLSTDVLIRIQWLDGSSETARLNAAVTSFIVQGAATFCGVFKTYLWFGIEHILNGYDHLLFVACLIFIAGSWRRILVTITGFTVAHSITLTLSALGLIRLPVQPIEAIIALSIVFLAREIVVNRRDTLTWRYPIAVSASFGLLHGFGFASALREIGLPQTEIPAALLSFNIGVEIGQIIFVAAVLLMFWLLEQGQKHYKVGFIDLSKILEKPIAYAVGGIAMFWTIERVSAFWV